ncbi:armadillo-type protein [Polychytrium aggregatum]|uniref:armadillo-type protein n=1 Tax=Polychytrium aggregatum TaxID=110093 RepID=UPI0022FF1BEB|nr:armadillo-type protein [Polychytrium aggregatum]KAI9202667.1 armadillo-type protein [Polychytrium aggregatum]
MGKHKNRKRFGRPRATPVAPSDQQIASDDTMATHVNPQDVAPILKKLNRHDKSDERSWAAAAISNLVQDPATLKVLLSGGLVSALIGALSDPHREVVVEVTGALRNLAVVGGDDVCKEMVRKDILTPLLAQIPLLSEFLTRIVTKAPSEGPEDDVNRKTTIDCSEQVISLVWSLCESSDVAVNRVTQKSTLGFLMEILNPEHDFIPSLVQAAGQCLNTITEENQPCHMAFQANPRFCDLLAAIANGDIEHFNNWDENRIQIRVLAGSILYNVRDAIKVQPLDLCKQIFPAISTTLDYDVNRAIELACKASTEILSGEVPEESGKYVRLSSKNENLMVLLEAHVATVQLGLELLANICADDIPEEENWEEMDAAEEENDEVELDEDLQDVIASESQPAEPENNERNHLLDQFNILPRVLKLASGFVVPITNDIISSFASELAQLQYRALGCLNNILDNVPGPWYQSEAPKQVWIWLFDVANRGAQQSGPKLEGSALELVEACVSAMWALLRGLKKSKADANIVPTEAHVGALIHTAGGDVPDSLKIKCIGVLSILGRTQGQIELNKTIGIFLGNTIESSLSLAVAAECLDAIYDVYGDKAYDYDGPVFVQLGFLNKLKQLLPVLKAKAKALDKRKSRDVRGRIDEALVNLRHFILYKEKERR